MQILRVNLGDAHVGHMPGNWLDGVDTRFGHMPALECCRQFYAKDVGMKMSKDDFGKYIVLLKKCTSSKALADGKRVHCELVRAGCDQNTVLGNNLVQMYGCCGSLTDARVAFDRIHARNVFSWNILIAAHTRNGHLHAARDVFDVMPQRNVVTWNTITAAYAQDAHVEEARRLFEASPERDLVSWNAMTAAYAQNGDFKEVEFLLEHTPQFHLVSWTAIVAAYAQKGRIEKAKTLFDEMPEQDVVSWTIMFSAYAQHGHLQEAREMFDNMPDKDSTSWTTMVLAYAHNGHLEEARSLFDTMHAPDVTSYNAMISAYSQAGELREAKRLFKAMPRRDVVSWTSMITAYTRHGDLLQARDVFDTMPVRDVASWSAIMAGYCQREQPREALELFRAMDLEGVHPTNKTFVSAIDACASIPAEVEGKIIHAELVSSSARLDIEVENALVTMHGRFGNLETARCLFERISRRDVVSWTAMIAAYAQNGHGQESLELFELMILEGVEPDEVTFINLLSACSHAGLVDDGWHYFVSMTSTFGMVPWVKHYVCMVDLLARAGCVGMAEELVKSMPYQPNALAWKTMLGACRVQGDVKRGEDAAGHAVEFEPEHGAPYVLLSQMHARAEDSQESIICAVA